jgi:hypothetical protein
MMAEQVERTYLQGYFVSPQVVVEVVTTGQVDYEQGQHSGDN